MLLLATLAALAAAGSPLPERDGVRLAEVDRLAEALGHRLWPGWESAPFAVLLVTPEREFLFRHPEPSPDFTPAPARVRPRAAVWSRPRQHDPRLQATFPAVGTIPTVVIGQAETTDTPSTRWVLIVLHEHFHQWQYSRPWYYPETSALGLSRGDTGGMWMLNYPFPYDRPDVIEAFSRTTSALLAALRARPRGLADPPVKEYLAARARLRSVLAEDDFRYLAFQGWQEGIARYTELKVAQGAASAGRPPRAFRRLTDATPYPQAAAELMRQIETQLESPRLAEKRRSAFYAWGAAEGLLLDAVRPDWRDRYLESRFSLEPLFEPGPRYPSPPDGAKSWR